MDMNNRRGGQSLRRHVDEEGQTRVSRSTQTLLNVESEYITQSADQSSNDSSARSSQPGHGSSTARNNTVTESGYSSNNRNTNSTDEYVMGRDASDSSIGETSGYGASQSTLLKFDDIEDFYAVSNENYNVRDGQSDVIEIQEVTPVEVSSEIAQETGDQFDEELHRDDGPVADGNRLAVIPPINIDLHRRRHIPRGAGRLARCFTCFRWPVAVQNWPCGCICNCLECAGHMTRCSQCGYHIDHYIRIG